MAITFFRVLKDGDYVDLFISLEEAYLIGIAFNRQLISPDEKSWFEPWQYFFILYNKEGSVKFSERLGASGMNQIQINEVDNTEHQAVAVNIQRLKQLLDDALTSSDQTLVENLIQETEVSLEELKHFPKTYQEKYIVFLQLNQSWLNVWKKYKHIPEAADLIEWIDHMTNYFIAYTHLYIGLSQINENRTGEYRVDLQKIVSGFLSVAEVVDVFIDFLSIPELQQIYDVARKGVSSSTRDIVEFLEDRESSNLVTQLRAYSSLIIRKIEEYIKNADDILEFVFEPTHQKAQEVLLERSFFGLDEEKFKQFVALLDAPPTKNENLHKLLTTKAPWD